MKKSVQFVSRIAIAVVLLAAVGIAAWWDHAQPDEPLLTGGTSPQVENVQIADARTLLACPGKPVLASLGEDPPESSDSSGDDTDSAGEDADGSGADTGEDADGPGGDTGEDAEPPVGTYDPDYAPDEADATSLINAMSLGPADSTPAPALLETLLAQDDTSAAETVELSGSGAVHNGSLTTDGPAAFTATTRADGAETPLVTGVRFGSATAGDLRGIAATPCIPAAAEQWLLGGQTEAGASAKLELMNPSDTAATVRLEIWGAVGPIDPVGSKSVLVPPGEHRSILLEGLAPGERRIAVRVQSSGARIGAVIQDVRTLGLQPAGVDYVAPSAPLSTEVRVPGIEIKDADESLLRLLIPGNDPGLVNIKLIGPNGEVAAEDLMEIEVPGGAVTDVSLRGVPEGSYTAVVESDVPITASGFVGTGEEDVERDIAWMPAVASDETNIFALPETSVAVGQTLVMNGSEVDVPARVFLVTDAGELVEEEVRIAAGETKEMDIPAAVDGEPVVGVLVESEQPITAGLALRAPEIEPAGVALLPATPRSILPSGIDVQLRR